MKVIRSKPVIEGAGVHLHRVFGNNEVPLFDPFLLLDHFGSDNPNDYVAGFPWHPHRGIETVTYMLNGTVEHGDSIGNKGAIESGDIQWMTAGSGIIHQEMPQICKGTMTGFKLWVNLPSAHKMMNPRYREIKSREIPAISLGENISAKIICGEINGTLGAVRDIVVDCEYLDITMGPETEYEHPLKNGFSAFAYAFEGYGSIKKNHQELAVEKGQAVDIGKTHTVNIKSGKRDFRFLLISGKPIGEPVAWQGPIVMNTQEELDHAFTEYYNGTFIRKGKAP
jgi:hypothetical protein